MIKAIFFDLDGTLLGMDERKFLELYLPSIVASFSTEIDYKLGASIIYKALDLMIENPSTELNNYESYKNYFTMLRGDKNLAEADFKNFEEFYKTKFEIVRASLWKQEAMLEAVSLLKKKGYRLVIATNPIFPYIATKRRVEWAGLDEKDFELITYQENSHSAKPNLSYYREILKKLNLEGNECMMVGNDVEEDMIASDLGLTTYLVTDCLISRKNRENEIVNRGKASDFLKYVKEYL